MNKIPLGAYFYPLTTTCPIRKKRAQEYGYQPIDETLFVKSAKPRFEGHVLPKIYSLGEKKLTEWDDASVEIMKRQVSMAREYGIDFFIFDSYMGRRDGKFIHEMSYPLNKAFLKKEVNKGMKFALMIIPESPRVAVPVPKNYIEKGRVYDLDKATAYDIVDYCAKHYWHLDNYLKIQGKPYLSIYMSQLSIYKEKTLFLKTLLQDMENYALQKYNIELYLVGVVTKKDSASFFENAGAHAITGYANLADFDNSAKPVQDYHSQNLKQLHEWTEIRKEVKIPYVPPAVVGWDASPRGEPGLLLQEVKGIYPFTPIVVGESPVFFGEMLKKALQFISSYVPKEEQYAVVCAWNEIAESMALLPQIINGTVDFSYLEALKETINNYYNSSL